MAEAEAEGGVAGALIAISGTAADSVSSCVSSMATPSLDTEACCGACCGEECVEQAGVTCAETAGLTCAELAALLLVEAEADADGTVRALRVVVVLCSTFARLVPAVATVFVEALLTVVFVVAAAVVTAPKGRLLVTDCRGLRAAAAEAVAAGAAEVEAAALTATV
jgi:hypothetical protein